MERMSVVGVDDVDVSNFRNMTRCFLGRWEMGDGRLSCKIAIVVELVVLCCCWDKC